MVDVQIDDRSLKVLVTKLRWLGNKKRLWATKRAIFQAGLSLRGSVDSNLNVMDHTQKALDQLDNPYAVRHGSINIHQTRPHIVHRQSGVMKSAIKGEVKYAANGNPVYILGFKYGQKRYFRYVIEGTRVMLPRNVLYATSQNENVRKAMIEAVKKSLERDLRK